jgi:hypothetical protein
MSIFSTAEEFDIGVEIGMVMSYGRAMMISVAEKEIRNLLTHHGWEMSDQWIRQTAEEIVDNIEEHMHVPTDYLNGG